MAKDERRNRFHQRKRVFAERDAIMDLVRKGWPGREIRTELGFEDVPKSTFYHNLRALKREAAEPSSQGTSELKTPSQAKAGLPKAKPKKKPAAPSEVERKRGSVRITTLGKGPKDRKPLDPDKWGDKK